MMASFVISPESSFSKYSIVIPCTGATSKLGIISLANWESDLRASARRTTFGVNFVVMFISGSIRFDHTTSKSKNWG